MADSVKSILQMATGQTHLHNLKMTRAKIVDATTRRDEAIRSALEDGVSAIEIGQAVGLSRQRVYQIAKRSTLS